MKNAYTILGLMSGSSLDGLDLALCRFEGFGDKLKWDILSVISLPISIEWKTKLSSLTDYSALKLARTDALFSKYVGEQIVEFIKNSKISPDFISSHGHTVFHEPQHGMTVQILNGGYLSGITKFSVISDFRTQDVSLSGEGAPLAPIVERDLFTGFTYYLNLGGICNLSVHHDKKISAFDVSPCNQVLNSLVADIGLDYDENGKMARTGRVCAPLLKAMNDIPYYKVMGPKSLDNSWVKEIFSKLVLSFEAPLEDKLYTVTYHIAQKIREAIKFSDTSNIKIGLPSKLMATGGGALNLFLVETIANLLSDINVKVEVPSRMFVEFKEAILMAYMGYLRIVKQENVISSVTGSLRNSCSGAIYYY